MCVDPPPVNNMQVVHEPLSNTEIDHIPKFSGGVQDFYLVRDREHC